MGSEEKPNGSVLGKMKKKAKCAQDDLKDKMTGASGAVQDKISDASGAVQEKIADATEAVQGKISDAIGEVNEIMPVIKELGYTVDGINIAVGLIPDVTLDISGLAKTVEDSRYREMLEEHKGHTLRIGVIKALQNLSVMQQKIQIGRMQSDNASITLGFPPKVSLEFRRE